MTIWCHVASSTLDALSDDFVQDDIGRRSPDKRGAMLVVVRKMFMNGRFKRAVIWSAGALPQDERDKWLNFVKEESTDPLDEAVADFVRSTS